MFLEYRCTNCRTKAAVSRALHMVEGFDGPVCGACRGTRRLCGTDHDVRVWFFNKWEEEFQKNKLLHDLD